jgi:uncharacterized protein YkvS
MGNLKRRIAWVVILLISHSVIFILGSAINRQNMLKAFVNEFNQKSAHVDLGIYTTYRDIAIDIRGGAYENAQCLAELEASTRYDELKSCLENQVCKIAIEKDARGIAPEVLGEAPLKFTYIESNKGIKRCK